MNKKTSDVKQGDICLIDFNPTLGDEMKKIRPAIVINGNFAIGLDLRIVAPITSWKPEFEKIWWLFKLKPTKKNNLVSVSAVNCFQMRCVSVGRINKKIGHESDGLEDIIATCQNCLEII